MSDDDELPPDQVFRVKAGGGFSVRADTADEAKRAIKELRLFKKSIQAERREVQAQIAESRQDWRERQAGRIPLIGKRTGFLGAVVRGKRRAERMGHADELRGLEVREGHDRMLLKADTAIADLERFHLEEGTASHATLKARARQPAEDPIASLEKLTALRDQGLITVAEFEAKRAERSWPGSDPRTETMPALLAKLAEEVPGWLYRHGAAGVERDHSTG